MSNDACDKCANCGETTSRDELLNNEGYCDECYLECYGELE